MPLIKDRTCTMCGKKFLWVIDRPGDGYWDRWRNDNGDTLGSWFTTNTLCYEHAMDAMPDGFSELLRTRRYEEQEPEQV